MRVSIECPVPECKVLGHTPIFHTISEFWFHCREVHDDFLDAELSELTQIRLKRGLTLRKNTAAQIADVQSRLPPTARVVK